MFDLIIFDLDGTLVDSSGAITRCFKSAAMGVGVSVSNTQIMAMIGMPLHQMFEKYVDGKADQCVMAYRSIYRRTCMEGSKLYPDVDTVLRSLSAATLAVATTKFTNEANILLDGMNIRKYFKFVCGMDMVKNPKPDPEVINKLLELSGIPKTRAVIVGDTTYDILAGKAAGIKTVAVTYGFQSRAVLAAAKPDFLIDNMKELQKILR